MKLTLAQARNAWSAAQELGAARGDLADVLERTGFVRTLGGVEVYLAARARVPSARARDIDALVAAQAAQVVPAVRGCIYLVARRHVPLALRVAELLSAKNREREQEKAGIRPGELADLGRAVVELLGKGPLTTDAIRKGLPAGAVRSLGDAGKKLGLSSPLPSALRVLEFEGKIERTLEGGKLDTERYLWRRTARNPFDGAKLPSEPVELFARLAAIFLRAAGTSTVRVFADWAGIGLRDAQSAVERAKLLPVEVEGIDEPSFAAPENEEMLRLASSFVGSSSEEVVRVAFLPFEDNLIALHGGPPLLVEPRHHGVAVPSWGTAGPGTLGDIKHMSTRGIVAEGRLVGLWEYDPSTKSTVTSVFDWVAPKTFDRIEALAKETTRFIVDELGHARSFSLDTDETLRERAAWVRNIGKPAPKKKPAAAKPAAAAAAPKKKKPSVVQKAKSAVKKAVTKAKAKAKK